jgi:glutathione peroxidase
MRIMTGRRPVQSMPRLAFFWSWSLRLETHMAGTGQVRWTRREAFTSLAFGLDYRPHSDRSFAMTENLTSIPLLTATGTSSTLADYAGKAVLIVNVASKCGLTPQYTGLEALYQKYKDKGLVVLGFPANNFAGQEPGSDEDIQNFCSLQYDVHFPVFAKLNAVGPDKHPLYAVLTSARPETTFGDDSQMRANLIKYGMTPNEPPELLWNFEKFLVGKDGSVAGRFAPDMKPDDPVLVTAIETALAA